MGTAAGTQGIGGPGSIGRSDQLSSTFTTTKCDGVPVSVFRYDASCVRRRAVPGDRGQRRSDRGSPALNEQNREGGDGQTAPAAGTNNEAKDNE